MEGSVTFLIAFGGIKKFSRGELHTKQPMMSNSVIFKLGQLNIHVLCVCYFTYSKIIYKLFNRSYMHVIHSITLIFKARPLENLNVIQNNENYH